MSSDHGEPPRDHARRILEQRSLARNADRIDDPEARAQVRALAEGRMSSSEFLRFVDSSPRAFRGLRRVLTQVIGMTHQQQAELQRQYEQQLDQIQTERQPTPQPGQRHPARTDEEAGWDDMSSWLE